MSSPDIASACSADRTVAKILALLMAGLLLFRKSATNEPPLFPISEWLGLDVWKRAIHVAGSASNQDVGWHFSVQLIGTILSEEWKVLHRYILEC
jgi:hypothetical protein